MERWYRPDEQWPRHPKPYWRELLKEARAAGWHLMMFDDHSWGRIVCSREVADAHSVSVFTSGRGAESFVRRTAAPTVRNCTHTEPPPVVLARRLLDGASALLDAAELALGIDADRRLAAELVAEAAQGTHDAEALFQSALDLDAAAAGRGSELQVLAAEHGVTPVASDLVDEADHRVRQAKKAVGAGRMPAGVARYVTELRRRIAALRNRLAEVKKA